MLIWIVKSFESNFVQIILYGLDFRQKPAKQIHCFPQSMGLSVICITKNLIKRFLALQNKMKSFWA